MTEKVDLLDKGFITLVSFMGSDLDAVNAARVSFGGVSKGPEKDKFLLDYLIENMHHSPIEHCVFKFHVKCPIFVARQWMRHRICSYNEISARYTEVKDEFYIPKRFRGQDHANKQGSISADSFDNDALSKVYEDSINASYAAYKKLLEAGVAREMARGVLPVCQYTQFYWTVNARALLNFITLRADKHAQEEIRVYAEAISKIFKEKMPWTWDAYQRLISK